MEARSVFSRMRREGHFTTSSCPTSLPSEYTFTVETSLAVSVDALLRKYGRHRRKPVRSLVHRDKFQCPSATELVRHSKVGHSLHRQNCIVERDRKVIKKSMEMSQTTWPS
ncbi:hypothetical protein AVEN_213538-1 [Araneus ventricosus]|uniref:Uncharacterized protein n=1 Tax=Araneus ventricosus TaxID=182803 RepID=A0A4Y2HRK5_ARAVE|nr:hypothetical protein AVEN_213538-1 [Araneus ventricosus]